MVGLKPWTKIILQVIGKRDLMITIYISFIKILLFDIKGEKHFYNIFTQNIKAILFKCLYYLNCDNFCVYIKNWKIYIL